MILVHQLDDLLFLYYMSGAKAYATTAGFESVCEAMYLGKPILMVPTHIEQACNAYDAALSGAGIVADCFDLDRLSELSKNHSGNMSFRHWVKQADWLILREFRPDLLFHELPAVGLRRHATNWVARLGRFLPI